MPFAGLDEDFAGREGKAVESMRAGRSRQETRSAGEAPRLFTEQQGGMKLGAARRLRLET